MGNIVYWLSEEQIREMNHVARNALDKIWNANHFVGDEHAMPSTMVQKYIDQGVAELISVLNMLPSTGKGPDNDNRTSRNGAAQQQRSGLEESAGEGDRGPDRDIQAAGRNGKGTGPDHQQYRATILGNEPAVIANRAIAYRPDRRQRLYAERA